VPLIALTGGIASGKSTVANRLLELGAVVISADELVRHVQRPGSPTLDAIGKRFGLGVIDGDGELDRAALGRLIFDDAIARADLEAIVHPAIGIEFKARIAIITAERPDAVIVYDIPLLVETNRASEFDSVIVLMCEPQIRLERLERLRGMTKEAAQARIDAQASEKDRLALADWTIDTSKSIDSTIAQTDAVWAEVVDAYRV
jgi:dephospho-CoA kinase